MLDPKFVRNNIEAVRAAVANKRESVDVERLVERDARRRDILKEVEALKHERNETSQRIGEIKRSGGDVAEHAASARRVGERIKSLDAELKDVDAELDRLRAWLPNVPHDSVPVGGETDNVVVRTWGRADAPSFPMVPHHELAERLGLMDSKRASKVSGSGFAVLTGQGARLGRALIQLMLDVHTREHGYLEVSVPYVVRETSLFGTGQLPKLESDMYRVTDGDLFLIPTAEVPITNLFRDETLPESELPKKLVGYTACFRREAGAYGKDTRGLQRLHQFDKVELVKFVHPDTSYDELESLVRDAEVILERLELPYRRSLLATGDLSFAAAKCFDLEVWAPAEGKWLEVSSCSTFESFQARRIGIRMKRSDGSGSEFLHTLNGSGLALPRLMIALLENHQTPDGTVRVPDALAPYMDGTTELS